MDLPRQLGPYRLEKKLGQGGMAEVFLATAFGASGFEKRVVLKTLLPELRGDPTYERMFLEEARTGAAVCHRNVVGVHELGVSEGVYWARLDYVDGLDLATTLRWGPLPQAVALYIADEIALALSYVHRLRDAQGRPLGLVHRDVSPSNILLSREGEVKLADFGIAKATAMRDVTRAGVRKGTYAYMSPEQVSGRPLNGTSDLFALASVLAELLTGRRLFEADTPLETMDRVREAQVGPLDDVPAELRAVLTRALAKSPAERFGDAETFRDSLRRRRRDGPLADAKECADLVGDRSERQAPASVTPSDTRISTRQSTAVE